MCAAIAMMAWARHVDRVGGKIGNPALSCFLTAVGFIGSMVSGSFVPGLIGLTMAPIGATAARALFRAIPTRFLTGVAASWDLAFINSARTLRGFVGPLAMGCRGTAIR